MYRGGVCTQAIKSQIFFFSSKRNYAENFTDLCITDPTVLSALQSTNSAVRDLGWYTVLITSHRIDTTKQQRTAALALQFRIIPITSYRIDTTSSKEKRPSHSVLAWSAGKFWAGESRLFMFVALL